MKDTEYLSVSFVQEKERTGCFVGQKTMSFFITLSAVAVMLLYALPGFLLVKTRAIKSDHIVNFSKVLLYVCQPCLVIYTFGKIQYSPEALKNFGWCFLLSLVLQALPILLFFQLFRKKRNDVIWRLVCVASVFSNCGFFGVPLLEKLLPKHPEAIIYSSIFALGMNMIGWSLGLYIISLDRKYISLKKILITPNTLGFLVALPFYFTELTIPDMLLDAISLVGRMSTPLCMMILGMRLATIPLRQIFGNWRQYFAVLLNQIAYPLLVLLILLFLPLDRALKTTVVILCACPVASLVQNYAELLGQGQKSAANMVLLGTAFSIVTVPLICLLL